MSRRTFSERNAKKVKLLHTFRNLFFLACVIILFFTFVVGVSRVSGYSMYPTLDDGDIVFYWRLYKNLDRGDILALSLPNSDGYVKRIAALPGDSVDIHDGMVYINGIKEEGMPETLPEEGNFTYPVVVSDGDVFMLGDNRPESIDSRSYGSFSEKQIRGVLKIRIHGLKISLL